MDIKEKMKLVAWLKECFRAGEKYNLLSMSGGKFMVDRYGQFIDGFCKARRKWTDKSKDCTYVWVPPKVDAQPLYIDIDLRYPEERAQPFDLFKKFADACGLGDYTIVAKPRMYEKEPGLWAGGCHVYFQRTFQKKALQGEWVRLLPLTELFEGQDPEQCLDHDVFVRCKGLVLPGCFKTRGARAAGRYNILGATRDGQWFPATEAQFLEHPEVTVELLKPFFDLTEEVVTADLTAIPEIKSEYFNLNKFLEVTEGWVPNNEDWKQVMQFLAKMNLDERKTAEALNAAWQSSSNENIKFLRRYKRRICTVGEGSIVRLLKVHATKKWVRDDIFAKTRYHLHDHIVEMVQSRKVFTESEVNDWLSNCYAWVDGNGAQCYAYRELWDVHFFNNRGPKSRLPRRSPPCRTRSRGTATTRCRWK